MSATVLHPSPREGVVFNVADYDEARRSFRWAEAAAELTGPRGLNIAEVAVDRHARGALAGKVALRWRGKHGDARDITYGALAADMRRFGNTLRTLGVEPGDVVFALCPRIPALYVAALGTLAVKAVFSPLFSAFGPDPIVTRVRAASGKVLVTTASLYARKIAAIRDLIPTLRHVIVVDDGPGVPANTLDWDSVVLAASSELEIPPTPPDTLALLHFTSGTTGRPKAAMHVHGAVIAHYATARMVLDLHPDDVFWCTADPGWVTGTSYGLIAPLAHGVTSVVDEADFVAERWYQLLERERVTVWYTAPTAIRMLMKAGPELARRHDLSRLRVAASVGEPLNPEAVVWGNEVLGLPILDNWWQTETGGIMIANLPCMDVRPGSMGKAMPGIDAGIVAVAEDGTVTELPAGEVGQLALRPGWPAMFRGYLHEDARYAKCFAGGWYLTGDLAKRDADGYYWFVGRTDDVIKSAGHLIGPFEVESALLEHRAVAEAGVIGVPHPVAGEVVKAFVSLKPGVAPSDELRDDLLAHARRKLGPAVAPREIAFVADVPHTRSGKIMRRLLRARELGLPEGDISTREDVQ
ncbi:MAG TPA: acetate--CoA ligase [Kofleriaceae bacterium]|nr:acetate--CoA ligase [Kofleriaceae bacterium]